MQVQKYKKRLECQKDLSAGGNLSERASTYQLEFAIQSIMLQEVLNVFMHVMSNLECEEDSDIIIIIIKEK